MKNFNVDWIINQQYNCVVQKGLFMKTKIITILLLVLFFIQISIVNASEDIYDVVLMWGQSNMTGFAGSKKTSGGVRGEDQLDYNIDIENPDRISIENFSNITGINKDILENYKQVNYVEVPIKPGTVYEYLHSNTENHLSEIKGYRDAGSNTERIGEYLEYDPYTNSLKPLEIEYTRKYLALEKSYGTNIVPEFGRMYYEKTGHKVVIVMASNAGEPIQHFLPHDDLLAYYDSFTARGKVDNFYSRNSGDVEKFTTQYIYEAAVKKYQEAIDYLISNDMTVGHKFYVVFQGEADVYKGSGGDYKDKYYEIFTYIHNRLKNDIGVEFGALIYVGGRVGNSTPKYVKGLNAEQKRIVEENSDIILGSSFPYTNYLKWADSPEETKEANEQKAKYSLCNTAVEPNLDHFNSAALSQIGYESAISAADYLSSKDPIKTVSINGKIVSDNPDGTYSFDVDSAVSKAVINIDLNRNVSFVDNYSNREVNLNYGKNVINVNLLIGNSNMITKKLVITRGEDSAEVVEENEDEGDEETENLQEKIENLQEEEKENLQEEDFKEKEIVKVDDTGIQGKVLKAILLVLITLGISVIVCLKLRNNKL